MEEIKKQESNVKKTSHSEFESEPIPQENRKPLWAMILIMAGFAIFSATIWTGADIANSFNLGAMIGIAIIGNILLTVYIALLAFLGGESSLSTHELSKKIFGRYGFFLTSSLALISQLGWFGVGVMMFVDPLLALIEDTTAIQGSTLAILRWMLIVVSGGLMVSTAFWGFEALKWVSTVAVPTVLLFGFVMIIMTATSSAGSVWDPTPGADEPYSAVMAIGLVFATFVSGGTLAPDFVRWAKNGKHAVISVIVSFFVCSTLMLIFGAFAFYGTGKSDLSDALIVMGLAPIGIVVLGANIWTTNDNGLYTQGLAASSMTGIEKKWCIIVLGAIGTLTAPIVNGHFIGFLNMLNLMLPGIGAMLILNGYFLKEDNSEIDINYYGWGAWLGGIIVSVIVNNYILAFIMPMYVIGFTILIYLGLYYMHKLLIAPRLGDKENNENSNNATGDSTEIQK